MTPSKIPFERMIFVCTHQRPDESACANANRGEQGGQFLVELLREEVKKRGLKGKIRVVKSGCLDVCASGPNIMVMDAQGEYTWLKQVRKEDLPAIVERYCID